MDEQQIDQIARVGFHAHETARLTGITSNMPFRDWDSLPTPTKAAFRAAIVAALDCATSGDVPEVDFTEHAGKHTL